MKSLSVGDSLRASWKLTKKHFGFLFLMLLVFFGVSIVNDILQALFKNMPLIIFLLELVFIYVDMILAVGMTNVYLKITGGETPAWSDMIEKKDYVWRYLGMGFLVFLMAFVILMITGTILFGLDIFITSLLLGLPGSLVLSKAPFMIPIFIVAIAITLGFIIRYSLAGYLIIDKKYKIIASLKESKRLTKGHLWMVFRFLLAGMGVIILGILCLIVGLFWAIPVAKLLFTSLYRQLSGEDASTADITVEPIPAMPAQEIHTSETAVA